jgi:hypothetical protein
VCGSQLLFEAIVGVVLRTDLHSAHGDFEPLVKRSSLVAAIITDCCHAGSPRNSAEIEHSKVGKERSWILLP